MRLKSLKLFKESEYRTGLYPRVGPRTERVRLVNRNERNCKEEEEKEETKEEKGRRD